MAGEQRPRPPVRKAKRGGIHLPVDPSAGAPRKTPARRTKPTNVVPLRPGDQHAAKRSNFRCRACGCPWFDAVVTIDAFTLKPGVAMSENGGPPIARCHKCKREACFGG